MTVTRRGRSADVVSPSRDDPVVSAGSDLVGGPVGRHAGTPGGGWWTPLRVMLAMVFVVSGLGLVAKQSCRESGWSSPGQFAHACYSDIPALYFARGLAEGEFPFISQEEEPDDHRVEYPVLTGLAMWLTAQPVPGPGDPLRQPPEPGPSPAERSRWFFDINALALAACAAVAVAATVRIAGRRPWDAAMVALAPGLLLAGTINWDLYAVALLALAMLAWARRRPVAAGVLLGLATAAKFYPLFLLGPLLVLCLRAGRLREFATTLGAAVVAWAAVNVPVMIVDFDGWARFYVLSRERGAGYSSVWFVLGQQGPSVPADKLNTVAGWLFAACCAAIAVLALMAPRRPRLAQLALLTVAAFLLTNKVYSPQYVLWLIPLAALARPRWRDFLIWQAGEVVHFFGIWLYLAGSLTGGDPNRALGEDGYGVTVLAHIAGTLWLVSMVVRDILRPEHDPVRADGSDDPHGGVLDGAADAVRLPAPFPR